MLRRFGLAPDQVNSVLLMRQPGEKSSESKARMGQFARDLELNPAAYAQVVGVFENEPLNLISWKLKNPSAIAVFVTGNFIPGRWTELPKDVNTISDYY